MFLRKAVARSGLPIRLVPLSGTKISALIKREHCRQSPTRERCGDDCVIHDYGIDCQRTHTVYQATCNTCNEVYIGTSARRIMERIGEHEASFRLRNTISSIANHARDEHGIEGSGQNYRGLSATRREQLKKTNMTSFLEHFDFEIIDQADIALDGYIRENFHIVDKEPAINGSRRNGYCAVCLRLHHVYPGYKIIDTVVNRDPRYMFGKPKLAPPDVETKITILRSGMQRVVENPNTWKWTKNHSRTQLESLGTSLSDPSSTLLPTDKTNKVCAMPRDLLASKLEDHFSEGWRPLPGDPSLVYQEEANSLMSECLTRAGLYSDYLCSRLSARYTWAPPVFPLAKDHKPQFPHCKVRVVQPVKGSAIEKLDIVVGRVLSQITRHLTYDVPSAQSFIETHLRPLSAQQSQIFQVSMDIESMYPSLPTGDRALTVIHQYLMDLADDIDTLGFSQSDIISMLKFILTHSYARAGDNYFLQIRGVGTGSLALYVDDSHSTWAEPDDHLPLLTSLNNIWPGELVFTVECSREGRLSFLDLMIDVSDSEGGRIEFEMFQKPTHSGQYLHFTAHCPVQTKLNIISGESRRILSLCSTVERAWPHLETLRSNLLSSGYPLLTVSLTATPSDHLHPMKVPYTNEGALRMMRKAVARSGLPIRLVPLSGTKISALIKREHCRQSPTRERCGDDCVIHDYGIDCQRTHTVYQATCNTCDEVYIGTSARRIMERIGEHEASFRLRNTISSIANHARDEHGIEGSGQNYRGLSATRREQLKKTNMTSFLEHFDFEIIDQADIALDGYIRENFHIVDKEPAINGSRRNGYVY
eukprot:sb/3462141/